MSTTPTGVQYGSTPHQLQPPAQPPSSGPPTTHGGALPFTGFELWAPLVIAAGFIAAGIALRRLSGKSPA